MSFTRIVEARWPRDADQVRAVREAVFVREQHVPPDLEWDGLDETCVHCLALIEDGSAIGTARLLPDGHIGRMAVMLPWRKAGVGSAMLQWMMDRAHAEGFAEVRLNAQVHALDFYRRHGFDAVGEVFMDAGIAHRAMVRALMP